MFVIPCLLKLIIMRNAMSMQAVAAGRSTEDFPPTAGPTMMPSWFLCSIIVKANAGGKRLRVR